MVNIMEAKETAIDDRALVTQAAINAAGELGISNRQLAGVLGVSASKLDRARAERASFSGKDYELALLLIRIYRALYAILGGNREQMQHWLTTPNRHLQDSAPLEQLAGQRRQYGPVHGRTGKSVRGRVGRVGNVDRSNAGRRRRYASHTRWQPRVRRSKRPGIC